MTTHPCLQQFGNCKFGNRCLFAHEAADLCVFDLQGKCNALKNCTRRHRVPPHPCTREFGTCKFGEKCQFLGYDPAVCIFWLQRKCTHPLCPHVHYQLLAPSSLIPIPHQHGAMAAAAHHPMSVPYSTVSSPSNEAKHPCMRQHGQCKYGDRCQFREYESDICVRWLTKKTCVLHTDGQRCIWKHQLTGQQQQQQVSDDATALASAKATPPESDHSSEHQQRLTSKLTHIASEFASSKRFPNPVVNPSIAKADSKVLKKFELGLTRCGYRSFDALLDLPAQYRVAFYITKSTEAIASIFAHGFDHGIGEYFDDAGVGAVASTATYLIVTLIILQNRDGTPVSEVSKPCGVLSPVAQRQHQQPSQLHRNNASTIVVNNPLDDPWAFCLPLAAAASLELLASVKAAIVPLPKTKNISQLDPTASSWSVRY